VFSQPGVASALLANYVPVKIDADQMPSTATKYGITALPTDVIITPQGQIVDSIRGRSEATQYVVRLNQIVATRRQAAAQIAQIPTGIPAKPAEQSVAQLPATNSQPAVNSQPAAVNAQTAAANTQAEDRYADYYRRNQGVQREQSALPAGVAQRDPAQSTAATASPPYAQQPSPQSYAQQQPASGPDLAVPSLTQSPPASIPSTSMPMNQSSAVQNITPPPMANQSQQIAGDPRQAAMPAQQQQAASLASQLPQQQIPASINQALPSPAGNASQQPPAATNALLPPASAGTTLCMDGFCPVTMAEKGKWVPGDRRYGAVHLGRTYLFASAEEQRRFFSDPDKYAPVISGNDVVQAIEKGQMIPGKREHGVFFNNHIFLFADENSLNKFYKDPAFYANQALESIQASNRTAQQMR
jgi:hypothetical protein